MTTNTDSRRRDNNTSRGPANRPSSARRIHVTPSGLEVCLDRPGMTMSGRGRAPRSLHPTTPERYTKISVPRYER